MCQCFERAARAEIIDDNNTTINMVMNKEQSLTWRSTKAFCPFQKDQCVDLFLSAEKQGP